MKEQLKEKEEMTIPEFIEGFMDLTARHAYKVFTMAGLSEQMSCKIDFPDSEEKRVFVLHFAEQEYYNRKAAEACATICEEQCAKSKWISVEERLPKKGGFYLVVRKYGNDVGIADFGEHSKLFTNFCGYKVTHWMPLPEAPLL